MTIKLYYDNLYLKEFDSKVEKIEEIDGKYHVVLQRTAFYPEGGGQPCDIGTIDGLNVIYVYEKDNLIYHVMEEKINKKRLKEL
ncbi:alanine--tRNA ligase-related protein [Clostridium senegalense]|uniref:alanine--tRNA ligase-related protein n=1 Tax=Clostridium senegalense TaxID=1465809 RepID=UPI0003079467|nr:alanine--tRNA ligase-related protein [Clostridium senegalense]